MTKRPLKWIEIDLSAMAHNLRWVRKQLGSGTRLMAVVKADAYGHGAEQVSRLAMSQGADRLGVLNLEEALHLRSKGIRHPIVLLCPPLPEEAKEAARAGLEVTVDSMDLARALSKAAKRPIEVHVDLDYGLCRWGLPPEQLESFLRRLSRLPRLAPAGLSAHLDYVPGKNAVEAEEKLLDFKRRANRAKAAFPGILRHCANSSILLDFPHWQMDMVRVGNLLYGINPTAKEIPLRSPWTLCARIVTLRDIPKGRSIGYASEYLAPRRLRVAALPVGYADGLTMEPAERFIGLGRTFHYYGWLKGKQVPFVGRCGLGHVLVDVSAVRGARLGDAVRLPIRRTAASPRIPRVYSSAG
ncbi:MAG: alanine racemase [Elusimicrobiota bacterium]